MATYQGPAEGTASLFLGTPPNVSLEVAVPSGNPSLGPQDAPIVDIGTGYTGTVVKTTAAGVRFSLPA